MPGRLCTNAACSGTLPEGKGSYCPRCGTRAATSTRRATFKWRWAIVLILFIGGMVLLSLGARHSAVMSAPAVRQSPDRQQWDAAIQIISRMTHSSARNAAFTDILHRALARKDYEYAYRIGQQYITVSPLRDAGLTEIVDAALEDGLLTWAQRAAEGMVESDKRDAALKRLLQAATPSR